MSAPNMKRASLAELREMRKRNELFHDAKAKEGGEQLSADFWKKAEIKGRPRPRSVHLKLDPEVFDFFYEESGGKGHLTKMQSVLRSYVHARKEH